MTKKERAAEVDRLLTAAYPDAECQLIYTTPLELLIATRLSAQCTDKRVNMVTPALFERFRTVDDFAEADPSEVADYIKSCGLYKPKAADIVNMCIAIRDRFDGRVPDSLEQLVTLPGVGRKTANLIMGDVYGQPAVVTDTHVIRISNLLGLCDTRDPVKVEMQLRKLLDPARSNDFCHRVVLHGRAVCTARSPRCEGCVLNKICPNGIKSLAKRPKA